MKVFPTCLFAPNEFQADLERRTVSGGESLSGDEDIIATDGGGRVFVEVGDPYLDDPEAALAWRALDAYCDGGARAIIVPFCDGRHQPTDGGDCASSFADEGEEEPGEGELAATAALRATQIKLLNLTLTRPLVGGEWLSIDHTDMRWRAYRIAEIVEQDFDSGTATVKVRPPLRESATDGDSVYFSRPRAVMRIDGAMPSPTTLGYAQSSGVRLVEDFGGDYDTLTPASGVNVTNHFALPGDGMVRDTLYQNSGVTATLQAFLTSGLIPISSAMRDNGFTLSIDGAAPNWLLNAARINFYTSSTASNATLAPSGSVTTGVSLSGDARTISCEASSIPAAATHFGTNLKWAEGPSGSLVYSSTNVIPVGAEAALAQAVMVNSGTLACSLTDVGASGTVESVSEPPVLADDEYIICRQGYKTYRRYPGPPGKHIVERTATSPESRDYNNTYQFYSVCLIDEDIPPAMTPGAFLAAFSATGASEGTIAVQSDCHPAYRINDMYQAGAHGILASLVTANAHGKANADQGSIWSLGGNDYILAMRYDSNRLLLVRPNEGTETHWSIPSALAPTGTATHVSGAINTGDITVSASVAAQLYPATRQMRNIAWSAGGFRFRGNGIYFVKTRTQQSRYRVPNAAKVLEGIRASRGQDSDFPFNDASIPPQLEINARWSDDRHASRVDYDVTAIQDHFCNFSWPTQWQPINARAGAGETLHFLIPATVSSTDGLSHDGSTPRDFSTWQNITGNAVEYYHHPEQWQDAAWWADNILRPPLLEAFGVKDSGDQWIRKFVMARSRIKGWTADGIPGCAHFLSGANKAYAVTRYQEEVEAGDVRQYVAGYGWMDLETDPTSDINFAFPLGDGTHEWNWWHSGALTDFMIPMRADLAKRSKKIIVASANCSITINNDWSISVSKSSGSGGFTALVGGA